MRRFFYQGLNVLLRLLCIFSPFVYPPALAVLAASSARPERACVGNDYDQVVLNCGIAFCIQSGSTILPRTEMSILRYRGPPTPPGIVSVRTRVPRFGGALVYCSTCIYPSHNYCCWFVPRESLTSRSSLPSQLL